MRSRGQAFEDKQLLRGEGGRAAGWLEGNIEADRCREPQNAPGERWDWLGIYHCGANPVVAYYLMWRYTHAAIDGTFRMGARPVPLPRGRYTVYLLRDDLYVKIAGANFVVR